MAYSDHAGAQVINTIAGTNTAGLIGDGGPAYMAELFFPTAVCFDKSGNLLIADGANRRIRKINFTSGIISTVAGSGCGFGCIGYSGDGGPATAAELYYPNGVVMDTAGNIFIPDYGHYRIRRVTPSGIINTYAGNGSSSGYSTDGGPATSVNINFENVAVDGVGNIYFGTGYRIRKVNTAGIISTYAGIGTVGFSGDGGPATAAQLNGNGYLAADTAGNLYIADITNYRVRKVNTDGVISTVAGNGSPGYSGDGNAATNATMVPDYLSVDNSGNLYITDTVHACVRMVDAFGIITTIAGSGVDGFSGDGGPATLARLYEPAGIAVDHFGNIYIADGTNNRIRKISYGNHPPHFTGGHSQATTVCEYSSYDSLNTLLSVVDTDVAQAESWGVAAAPAHGTVAAYCLRESTGGVIFPSGIYYTPVPGYTGVDSVKILVTDGLQADTTTIYITVTASPGVISGQSVTCTGMSTTLVDTTGTGTWSSNNTAVASIGLLSGVLNGISAGIATITFTPVAGCINTKTITIDAVPGPITGPVGVCAGSSATFSNVVTGGTWTSSSPAIATVNPVSGILTGIMSGPDTLTYTMLPGCAASLVTSVYPLPAPISGAASVCAGSTTTLADASSPGVWFSSNISVASVGLSSGVVTGLSAGTTIISYSFSSGLNCTTTRSITVNPIPGAITGTHQLCPGQSTTWADPGGGNWSSSSPSVASIGSSTGSVLAVAAGSANITYTLPTGCSTSAVLTVNPLPSSISGPSIVCAGSSATLSDAGGGSWSSTNPSVATIAPSGTISGILAGTDTIAYTLSTGCNVILPVTVAPLPASISGPVGVCLGLTANLTDSTSPGTWSSFAPALASINPVSGVVTGLAAGTTTLTFTSGAGCITTMPFTVEPLPSLFSVSGGGTMCAGTAGSDIGLTGSTHTIHYTLFDGGTTIASLSGTGAALDFGLQTAPGTYTVVATNIGTGCTRVMTGSATVIVNPLPAAISGPAAVCLGSSITLSDAGGGTWITSTPAVATIGSATALVTGLMTGTTNITYTLPTGCYITGSVTVSAAPAAITGPSAICVGSATLLADSVAGGLWSSSNPGLAAIGSLSGMLTGISSGVVTITYSLGSGCTKTKNITVNPLPAAISGLLGVCTGHAVSLSDSTIGGHWISSAPAVASVGSATGVVTGLLAGTASISYLTTAGCAATSIVTVNSAPAAISGSMHACTGQNTTLADSAGGGVWTCTPATIATVGSTSGVVTGVSAGTASITYSLGSGCTVAAILTVNTTPAPVAGPGHVCVASAVSLSDTTTGGTWSCSNPVLATVSVAGLVSGLAAGNVIISYTMSGCAATWPFTVNPLPAPITGVSTLCSGASATLGDTTSGGYWYSSAPALAAIDSATGVLHGVAAGLPTITYTTVAGCKATRAVTINAVPDAITGGSVLCIGSVISLSDSTTGGLWETASGGIINLSSSGVVTGLGLGTASISYVVAGCAAVKSVTVGPLPPPVSGPGHVCPGGLITLTDAGTGTWSSGSPTIATVGSATGAVTGGSPGTVLISYSLGPGCVVSATVTVLPFPAAITGPASLCTGASATLADTASGGTWSSSASSIVSVGSTGVIHALSAGTAVVSYAIPAGCPATRNITSVTVPEITGIHNICAWGDTMTVSDSTPGGLYTSSLVSVTNLGGGLGRVVGGAPGTATVTYIIAGGCSASRQFTVNPLPGPISGMTPVCPGDSMTLVDGLPGAVWSASNPAVLVIGSSSGIANAIAPGSDTIRYTFAATGCSIDTVVSVAGLPNAGTITGPDSLCTGSTISVADPAPGGTWGCGGIVSSILAGVVTGLSPGNDTITYAVTNMCGTSRATKAITVNPLPAPAIISGADSICVGNNAILSASDSGGIWSIRNTNASISAGGLLTGLNAGQDTVLYLVQNAWCSASSAYSITIIPLDLCGSLKVPEPAATGTIDWKTWPNPTSGEIECTANIAGTLRILNMQGIQLAVYPLAAGKNKLLLPALLADGTYLLEFTGAAHAKSIQKLLLLR